MILRRAWGIAGGLCLLAWHAVLVVLLVACGAACGVAMLVIVGFGIVALWVMDALEGVGIDLEAQCGEL